MSAAQNAIGVRRKCSRFRILVLGRANAGKTTLLKKVCDSVEDPEIWGPNNKRIDPAHVEGSAGRGIHDIKLQFIFKSNPGFIFHDSGGFESGSAEEGNQIQDFIRERGAAKRLSEQLHAIWYCVPTDTTRPLLKADDDFFATNFQGKVPVIAIFTKLDGLADRAFTMLVDDGKTPEEALGGTAGKTAELLETNFLARLQATDHPPSDYVQLEDMREESSNCKDLIEKTADSITDEGLSLLLVSVQQNNINLSIRFAVNRTIRRHKGITKAALTCFPHVWLVDRKVSNSTCSVFQCHLNLLYNYSLQRIGLAAREPYGSDMQMLLDDASDDVTARVKLISGVFSCKYFMISWFFVAICICAEHTFTQATAVEAQFAPAFSQAVQAYHTSGLRGKVDRSLEALPWASLEGLKPFTRDNVKPFVNDTIVPVIFANLLRKFLLSAFIVHNSIDITPC
ncbi:hypothetical protein C8R46DRAFT_1124095 [Mycena filopes]|nr:hypothetical protein C8R46DRAFT_1124095 [Mycena filopes]